MSLQGVYRSMPVCLAVPLAFLSSAVTALALAVLGAVVLNFLLDEFHGPLDLVDAIFVAFVAGPSFAVLAFVLCFSILISWHHRTSWLAPTFAFAFGAIFVCVWAHDFGGIGMAYYVPGAIAWLLSCWFLQRNEKAHSEHVAEA